MKYLPWIIIAVVAIYLLKKLSGGKTILAPQTQFSQVAQPDPFAAFRAKAFDTLANVGIAQIGAETRTKEIAAQSQAATQQFQLGQSGLVNNLQAKLRELDVLESLGLKSNETELAKAGVQ